MVIFFSFFYFLNVSQNYCNSHCNSSKLPCVNAISIFPIVSIGLRRNLVGSPKFTEANLLHSSGFEHWNATLLILLKNWHFIFRFPQITH